MSPSSNSTRSTLLYALAAVGIVCALVALLFGGSLIADKDRIVIARFENETITRGDFKDYLSELPDEERPLIQTLNNALDALNFWINDRIKGEIAKTLSAEGKIQVSRDIAREQYFEKHPEFRNAYQLADPTPLGLSQSELAAIQYEIEAGTDEEVERLLREEALRYTIQQAVQNRTISITPDEIRNEYEARKNELVRYEFIEFFGLQFPLEMPQWATLSGEARRRIDSGESFNDVVSSFVSQNPGFGLPRSGLQNDPNIERFKSFWATAHGAQKGQIIGPVLLPAHDEYVADPQTGQPVKRTRPAAQVLIEILNSEPQRLKTLEEAVNEVATTLATQKVIAQLRAERGVEVYPEKMENPGGVGDQYKDIMIDTGASAQAIP